MRSWPIWWMPKEPVVSKVPRIMLPNVPERVSSHSGTRGVQLVTCSHAVCLLAHTLAMASAGMSDRCPSAGLAFPAIRPAEDAILPEASELPRPENHYPSKSTDQAARFR